MIKSVLRLIPCSALSEKILTSNISRVQLALSIAASRNFSITSVNGKEIRSKGEKVRVISNRDGDDQRATSVSIDSVVVAENLFPDADTPNKVFDGIPYNRLPIINIKSTSNNTVMSLTDHKGLLKAFHSSGREGFKNAKRGTNVAAQQAAISFSSQVLQLLGHGTVRVRVQGIGPGRMSSLKGLHMSGIKVISITDETRVSWNPLKPRKQRRI